MVAVAFACQIFPDVPVLPYDVRMDRVITPDAAIGGRIPGMIAIGARD